MNPTIARHEEEQSEDWTKWMKEQAQQEPVFIAQAPSQLDKLMEGSHRLGYGDCLIEMVRLSDQWFVGRPLAKIRFLADIKRMYDEKNA